MLGGGSRDAGKVALNLSVIVPSPLVEEGQGAGDSRTSPVGLSPTPPPSPQGGGESPQGRRGETAAISLCGAQLMADSSGALYWPAEAALLVADLHLEKGSSLASRGVMLPPYDTRETLARLAEAIGRFDPARVIALGDSFHDTDGTRRIAGDDLDCLRGLQKGRTWTWILGNHDPQISPIAGGTFQDVLTIGALTLRHEPARAPARGEIAGHLHPTARLSHNGASIRRPCFVGNESRLVMPAFGAFTGGLNVLDAAFRPLFAGTDFTVWMLGDQALYCVPTRRLSAD